VYFTSLQLCIWAIAFVPSKFIQAILKFVIKAAAYQSVANHGKFYESLFEVDTEGFHAKLIIHRCKLLKALHLGTFYFVIDGRQNNLLYMSLASLFSLV